MGNPQESEELYVKKFYVIKRLTATWDDFHALGASKEETLSEINYGPFGKEFEARLKKEEFEKNTVGKESGEKLLKRLGIPKPTATLRSFVFPYDERIYGPHSLDIAYQIISRLEPFKN